MEERNLLGGYYRTRKAGFGISKLFEKFCNFSSLERRICLPNSHAAQSHTKHPLKARISSTPPLRCSRKCERLQMLTKVHVGVQNNRISLGGSPQAYFSFNHLTSASRNKSNTDRTSGHGTAGAWVDSYLISKVSIHLPSLMKWKSTINWEECSHTLSHMLGHAGWHKAQSSWI